MTAFSSKTQYCLVAFTLLFVLLLGGELSAAAPSIHQLGPTGLTGTISGAGAKVTEVAEGSPADGKIKKGDEIIGVASGKFKGDVRKCLAAAINEAESKQGGGKLTVILKGDKKVDLQLKVLGSYSETAPYDCPKSELIIDQAAEYLAKQINDSLDPENKRSRGIYNSGATHSGLLGLMATGEKEYIDLVAKAIKASDILKPDEELFDAQLKGEKPMSYVGWYWGYNCILLGEYYLLTGDESVLPALEVYAVSTARGQDPGGLWGHRMAVSGRHPGYAQMNQSSLSSFMGILMAKRCGIDSPVLNKGIERTYAYYSTYIGEGGFNYGVHGPNSKAFNNNGMSGSATMCMALMKNEEGVEFFSKLSATAYDNLEQGHASNFFNPLWTPLAANFCGPEVTQQFFDESLWFHTCYRAWDGSFHRAGKESGNEGSQTGVALLTYCLPRKALFITGKYADKKLWLKGKEADEVIRMSQIDFKSKSDDELLALFDHPIPQVRGPAIWAMRERDDVFLPKVVEMLKSGSNLQKISAMEYFGYKCPPEQAYPQIEAIGAILRNKKEDVKVRMKAAATLSCHGEKSYGYFNDLLQFVVDDELGDDFGDMDESLGRSLNGLCATPYESGLVTDKDLFYQAVHKLLDHKRQSGRAEGVKLVSTVPIEDFWRVADKLMYIIEDKDRTYHSYHAWQSTIGPAIEILARLNIKEGLPHAAGILDRDGGKWGFKIRMLCAALPKYGANAQEALNKIKTDERLKNIEKDRFFGLWRNMVKAIEEDPAPKKLITLEEVLKMGEK